MTEQDSDISRAQRLRERFQRPAEGTSWLDLPRRAGRFLVLAIRKARSDELTRQSSALAFITLVSLIPLLTAFSVVGARAFEHPEDRQRVIELLGRVFPYSEQTLVDTVTTFVENADRVSGFGFLVFLATALMAFSTIEETVNRVWNVRRGRPFRTRLLSFTLLLFWGPVLIGATYSGLFVLSQQAVFQRFTESLPAQFIPFVVTLLGLTMLYWLVPYTTVRFGSAVWGGFTAALLLEALRQGFSLYVKKASSISLIYGGLGLAFFFLVSVQLTWWIILLGTEVTYCTQHHAAMRRERRRAGPAEGSWLGLVALVVIADRYRSGEPITPHEELADRLRLPTPELIVVLGPLLEGGLLREIGGDDEGFLLGRDPHQLRLAEVFELYERHHWEVLEALPGALVPGLEQLRARLAEVREREAEQATLADLLAAPAGQAKE
ncbi:MAG TPA: YihY/virulence factor BrkB family protein [Thermoanaerobaculia bacterium]